MPECKVSFSTVSKALKGSPEISFETTEFIQKKAREMGYHPNIAARSLRTNRTYDIGVVFEDKSSGCYAPILFDTEKKELVFTPIYYYIGHFSKYVRPGSKRIATTKYSEHIHVIAFKNPDNGIVLVMMNTADSTLPAVVRHNDVCTSMKLEPHSITTVRF